MPVWRFSFFCQKSDISQFYLHWAVNVTKKYNISNTVNYLLIVIRFLFFLFFSIFASFHIYPIFIYVWWLLKVNGWGEMDIDWSVKGFFHRFIVGHRSHGSSFLECFDCRELPWLPLPATLYFNKARINFMDRFLRSVTLRTVNFLIFFFF
jgi:hypothetical protein